MLADAATAHPDGTFSLLRGGITEVNVPKNKPAAFKGALICRITATPGESGQHEIKIRCLTEDGGSVVPDVTAQFQIPASGGAANLVMDMQLLFPNLGRYEFSVTVDKIEMATWTLEAKELKVPPPKMES